MMRLDRGALTEQRAEPRSLLDLDLVVGEDARRLLVLLVADDLGQVLDEVAAAGDVQHLRAAADREHGHVALERGAQERQLGPVALRTRARRLGVCVLAVLAPGRCPSRRRRGRRRARRASPRSRPRSAARAAPGRRPPRSAARTRAGSPPPGTSQAPQRTLGSAYAVIPITGLATFEEPLPLVAR